MLNIEILAQAVPGPADYIVVMTGWACILFAAFLFVAANVFTLWMLFDCLAYDLDNPRIVWVLLIVFLHVVGALMYYIVRRPQRMSQIGR